MSIAIVSIPVTDPIASRDFYRDVIGFTLLRDEAMGPEMRWIQLQPKDGGATIALVTWFEGLKPGGHQGLMLGVEDVDSEHTRLAGLGVELTPIEEQPWGRFTMLKDPDGNGWILTALTNPDEVKTR
jgi:predicted enzyme related to lactoylglutathione lyase